ncbi:MAG: glutamine--fructose-6-phosphate transaminase (isomerizing) [Pseudobdellovibrionaceae bacterium]
MCGIVGYLGDKEPQKIIIQGLKKLEYRGYDSAGIAIIENGKTQRLRAAGKLKNLEEKLIGKNLHGKIGIGHTRWATHGAPNETNAHPHQVGPVSLVHNGIIENYQQIRKDLISRGKKILSDTDSELVAHLIAEKVEQGVNLEKSVFQVLPLLKGAFSILVISETEPDVMVCFKDGPPLVVGLGKNENFVASDVQALLDETKDFYILDDREVAVIRQGDIRILNHQAEKIQKELTHLNWNPELAEKQGFSHFMLKEVYEQPRSLSAALENLLDPLTKKIHLQFKNANLVNDFDRIIMIACGTSYYAAMIGKYYIEKIARIPVEVDFASEFRYRDPVVLARTLVFSISQSGETADTLAAIRLAKERGAKVLSLCNVKNSSIDREAHEKLYMNAGPEIGVASTKAFTCSLAVLACFAIYCGVQKKLVNEIIEDEMTQALLSVPSQIEVVLAYDKYFEEASNQLKLFKGFLYMGRGVSYPIALEGALKLKELAYMHAEGYAAGEMKHGPLALIDERMAIVMIAPHDQLFEKTLSNLEEARARGGQIISIGTGDDPQLKSMSRYYLSLPVAHWMTNPILSVIPLQLMSYHLAVQLGYDVDQPRNLAKSVTVE